MTSTPKKKMFQVYDEDETVWVVEVVPGEGQYAGHRLLDDRAWRSLTPKLQALHVGTAVLFCQYDRRLVVGTVTHTHP